MLAAACGEGQARRGERGALPPEGDDIAAMVPAAPPLPPRLSLEPGARYFDSAGVQAPLMLRNVSAPSVDAFSPLFQAASEAGTAGTPGRTAS